MVREIEECRVRIQAHHSASAYLRHYDDLSNNIPFSRTGSANNLIFLSQLDL